MRPNLPKYWRRSSAVASWGSLPTKIFLPIPRLGPGNPPKRLKHNQIFLYVSTGFIWQGNLHLTSISWSWMVIKCRSTKCCISSCSWNISIIRTITTMRYSVGWWPVIVLLNNTSVKIYIHVTLCKF